MLEQVKRKKGYFDQIKLDDEELNIIRCLIKKNYIKHLSKVSTGIAAEANMISMDFYHTLLDKYPKIIHREIWTKAKRLLPVEDVGVIKGLKFFQKITNIIPGVKISNEEFIFPEEFYWRLVRPLTHDGVNDVGPMHADRWFWDLGKGVMLQGFTRVKMWMSIFNESGQSGFRFVSGSHLYDWPYAAVLRDGYVKPKLEICDSQLDIEPFICGPGGVILFNDKLLHGGMVGGEKTRVSLECTLLIPDKIYNEYVANQ